MNIHIFMVYISQRQRSTYMIIDIITTILVSKLPCVINLQQQFISVFDDTITTTHQKADHQTRDHQKTVHVVEISRSESSSNESMEKSVIYVIL